MLESPVVEVANLSVSYRVGSRFFGGKRRVVAVDDVSLSVSAGEVLAIVGESGSGKSTLARAILRLLPIDHGEIVLDGVDVSSLSERRMRPHRSKAQYVFQDPYSSLDPLMTASEIVGESLKPLDIPRRQRMAVAHEMLSNVGLSGEQGHRYPDEFSGGQRQRIAIARALAPEPKLIVCDEPVSALDLSTQNQVIALLDRLRHERGVAYLFISHDLAVVEQIADRIAVMYAGQIVEEGPTRQVFDAPTHPYTLALLSAIPRVGRAKGTGDRLVLAGDLPDPENAPAGCRFHPRCPFAMEICSQETPAPTDTNEGGTVACHLHQDGPYLRGASILTFAADQR